MVMSECGYVPLRSIKKSVKKKYFTTKTLLGTVATIRNREISHFEMNSNEHNNEDCAVQIPVVVLYLTFSRPITYKLCSEQLHNLNGLSIISSIH